MLDLNKALIRTDGKPEPTKDYSTSSPEVSVYFRDLKQHLIHHIDKADIVVGCVAWLTDPHILAALTKKDSVSIVVQKEDFLRPDENPQSNWKRTLHNSYNAIRPWDRRGVSGTLLQSLSQGGGPEDYAISCVGNHNKDRSPAFPRMHNKFVVFCKWFELEQLGYDEVYGPSSENELIASQRCYGLNPYAVWTGSFNFSLNAGRSLENAVVLSQHSVVEAYYHEWAQIYALSEPLDWASEWSQPQFRIGS